MDTSHDKEWHPTDALAQDLRALDGPLLMVPKHIDEAIRARAHRRIRRHRYAHLAAVASAVAAGLFLAVSVYWTFWGEPLAPEQSLTAYYGDGETLNLQALARQIDAAQRAQGRTPTPAEIEAIARVVLASAPPGSDARAWQMCYGGRIGALDVFVDSGANPLVAYRMVLADPSGRVKVIGVEDGSPAGFRSVPVDPYGPQSQSIYLAAMNTGAGAPSGKIRIARLHVIIFGDGEPQYRPMRFEAATVGGEWMPAAVAIVPLTRELNPESFDGAAPDSLRARPCRLR